MSSFSNMLSFLRKREGLSQAELGKRLGIAKSTVSMYENDERKPSFEMLEIIADYFNINMDTLVGGSESSVYPADSLSPTERRLISAWRQAAEKDRRIVAAALEDYGFSYQEDGINAG